MKAGDLRIGNYVTRLGWDEDSGGNIFGDPEGDEIVIVDVDILKAIIENRSLEKYEPIPLTEQWLIDVKDNFDFFEIREKSYRGKYIFINIQDIILYFFTDTNTIDRPDGIEYKYVHSLQNLYFALTDKELTK
jgi:hypothetical protein